MTRRAISIGALLFCSWAVPAPSSRLHAQTPRDLVYQGSTLWTKAQDIKIRGSLGYAAFQNGLAILDVSVPGKPVRLSQVYLGGGYAVDVREGLAVVAAAGKGLALVDVSDPRSARLIAVFPTKGECRDVLLEKDLAYVAAGESGLLIVNVSDPAAPAAAGAFASPGDARGLAKAGNLVFLAAGLEGLQIIDASDPRRPAFVGALKTDGTSESVAVSGSFAFIADGSSGLKTVDVHNPSAPKQAAALTASGYARSVSADGNLLGLGCLYDGGYQIFDISRPDAPVLLSTNKYTMYNEGWRVVLGGGGACVVDYFSGIFFMDLADPKLPRQTGWYFTPSTIVATAVEGSAAFSVGELSGLQVFGLADPSRPAFLAGTSIFRGVQSLTASGGRAYVTDRWGVRIFDASNPSAPRQIGTATIPAGVPRAIVAREKTLYLTADGAGFYVIDTANPGQSKIVGRYPLAGFSYGLAVSGDRAFLANSDTGLHVLDLKNPAAPALLGSLKLGGEPSGIVVRGTIAYIAAGSAGLKIIDVADPGTMKVLADLPMEDFAGAVALGGDFAFVADGNAGVKKIRIADPKSPQIVASFDTPGLAQSVTVSGPLILVSDTNSVIILK